MTMPFYSFVVTARAIAQASEMQQRLQAQLQRLSQPLVSTTPLPPPLLYTNTLMQQSGGNNATASVPLIPLSPNFRLPTFNKKGKSGTSLERQMNFFSPKQTIDWNRIGKGPSTPLMFMVKEKIKIILPFRNWKRNSHPSMDWQSATRSELSEVIDCCRLWSCQDFDMQLYHSNGSA